VRGNGSSSPVEELLAAAGAAPSSATGQPRDYSVMPQLYGAVLSRACLAVGAAVRALIEPAGRRRRRGPARRRRGGDPRPTGTAMRGWGPGRAWQVAVVAAIGSVTVGVVAPPARAALTASLADLTLPAVLYSHADRTSAGTATLTATNSDAVSLGWNVTVMSSDLAYSGPYGGTAIPASRLALTSAAAPERVSGQAVDPVGGPKVPAVSPIGSLDSPRKVLQALVAFGRGTYAQQLGLTLTVPGRSHAGTYTATITTTIATGP
jgi:hypothetical protein